MIHYRTATRLQPQAPEAWVNIGALFSAMEQYDSAYYHLAPLHERLPRTREIYVPLLKAQMELGKEEEAARTFLRFQEFFPDVEAPMVP